MRAKVHFRISTILAIIKLLVTAEPNGLLRHLEEAPYDCDGCDACVTAGLVVITDKAGEETSVQLENNDTSATIFSFTSFESEESYFFFGAQLCQSTCYRLLIFDEGSDGICCLNGQGGYELYFDGKLVGSGGAFGDSEAVFFGGCQAPTSAPTTAPSSAPSITPTSADPDDYLCFSGEVEVIVQDKGAIKMELLKVGDFVKVGGFDTYEQVYAFAHRAPQMHTEFLQLHTNAGAPLEMTAGHLVYVNGKTNPIRADSIKVGDRLEAESNDTVVQKITLVHRNGIYNPLTRTGTIQVNGITASTFISFEEGNNEFVELNGGVAPLLSHHHFAHHAIAPFWFYCTTLALCDETNKGMPNYVSKGIDLIEWSQQQHILFQILLWASFRVLLLASILIFSMTVVIPASLISTISSLHLQQWISFTGMAVVAADTEMKGNN